MSRTSLDGSERFYLMVNAYWEPLVFELPALPDANPPRWRQWIDTSRPAPDDIHGWDDAPVVDGSSYVVGPRTIVALVA